MATASTVDSALDSGEELVLKNEHLQQNTSSAACLEYIRDKHGK
jgi:hypothetical protein